MIDINSINKMIEQIQKEGYTYPTEYGYVQNSYARIIIPTGRNRGGQIRNLEEVNMELYRRYDNPIYMTRDEYDKEVKSLLNELQGNTTIDEFKEKKLDEYRKIVDDSLNALGIEGVDSSQYTLEELKDAVEKAHKSSQDDSKGSPSFYEHLANNLGI